MRPGPRTLAAAALAAVPLAARAQTTITFAANACSGGGNTSAGYSLFAAPFDVQGFRFTSGAGSSTFGFATPCSGTGHTYNAYYAGAPALYNNATSATTTLTQIGGTPFAITSIDLAPLIVDGPLTVTFIGTLAGGLTVTQSFLLPGGGTSPALATYAFLPTFTNLASLQFGAQDYPYYQFTNLHLDGGAPVTGAPEPATWTLLGTGLVGLGAAWRRRRA